MIYALITVIVTIIVISALGYWERTKLNKKIKNMIDTFVTGEAGLSHACVELGKRIDELESTISGIDMTEANEAKRLAIEEEKAYTQGISNVMNYDYTAKVKK